MNLLTIDEIQPGDEILRYPPGIPLMQNGVAHKVKRMYATGGKLMIETDRGTYEQLFFFDARIVRA